MLADDVRILTVVIAVQRLVKEIIISVGRCRIIRRSAEKRVSVCSQQLRDIVYLGLRFSLLPHPCKIKQAHISVRPISRNIRQLSAQCIRGRDVAQRIINGALVRLCMNLMPRPGCQQSRGGKNGQRGKKQDACGIDFTHVRPPVSLEIMSLFLSCQYDDYCNHSYGRNHADNNHDRANSASLLLRRRRCSRRRLCRSRRAFARCRRL